jgi:DNA-binding protein YbaB
MRIEVDMRHHADERMDEMAELHRRAEAAWCTVEDSRGLVRVTVGQTGELVELWLHPDVAGLQADEITAMITDCHRTAGEQMRQKVLERFEAVYGVAWSIPDLLQGRITSGQLVESLARVRHPKRASDRG